MTKKTSLWLALAAIIFIAILAALFMSGALHGAINFILHIDRHLSELSAQYGAWIYAILFAIIFCETGLVITPFLPGDSLLFAAGSIAVLGSIIIAAIIGDAVNFAVGKYLGERLFANPDSRIFRRSYLQRTESFYAKHGGKTIILARFVPIVRTFAPFVAGMGHMRYGRFFRFNIIGGIAWVALFSYAGFWFGQRQIVKENLTLILLAIIMISILPAIIEIIRARRV